MVASPAGTLNLSGMLAGGLGTIQSGSGILALSGVLTNTGHILVLDGTPNPLRLQGGTIHGGTIRTTNGASLVVQNGTLDGVAVNGVLDVGNSYNAANLTVTNGLVLNGTALVGNSTNSVFGSLAFAGSQTLGGAGTVVFGQHPCNALYLKLPDTTLTLGPGITVRGQSGMIGAGISCWGGPASVSVVNQGLIQADAAGGTISVGSQSVVNLGVICVTNGGNLIVDGSAPIIFGNPQDLLIEAGGNIEVSVRATGKAPLLFQWWRDGNPVEGATDNPFRLPAVTTAQGGAYYCVVSNSLGVATSLSANVTVTNYALPTGIAGPVIVRVAVPVGSTDAGSTASRDGVWEVSVPPFPFNTNSGIGNILNPDNRTFCMHDHFCVAPYVPYPDRAMVTYEFNQPAMVGFLQCILHCNGIVSIEGFAGDTTETLQSVGVVTGSKGIPPAIYCAQVEWSTNTFAFPNPRSGKIFVMVIRRTSLGWGYANYQTYLYAPDGRQYMPATSAAQVSPLIAAPKQGGAILVGDSLFFSASAAPPGMTGSGYRWEFDPARTSSAPQPGYISFPTPGTNVVTCSRLHSSGGAVETDSRNIVVVPDEGHSPDLAVVSVAVPLSLAFGSTATLSYTVTNHGPGNVTATNWIDAVYLSHDAVLDATDILLAGQTMARSLAAGAAYTNSVDLAIPVVEEGNYHLIVSVDDTWQVLEVHQMNNEYATPVLVGAATLTPGLWTTGQVTKADSYQYYRVDVSEAQALFIEINSAGGLGFNRLYASRSSLPTAATFDYTSPGGFTGNPSLAIPLAGQGTWYILVNAAQQVGDGAYSIRVRPVEMQLVGVAPTQGAADQNLTLDLTGIGFVPSGQVSLVGANGLVYHPTSSEFISPERITASFASNSLPPMIYSVLVARGDGSTSSVSNILSITASGSPKLEARLIVPGEVGRNTVASLYLEYANTGTVAMPAPLLVLQGSQGAKLTVKPNNVIQDFWTCGQPSDARDLVQIIAEGQTPGVLQPGERIRVPVHYLGLTGGGDLSQNTVQFAVGALPSEMWGSDGSPIPPIPWASLKDQMRPSSITPDAWEALWLNFTSEVGTTWADYQRLLFDNASYLALLGQRNFLNPSYFLGESVGAAPDHAGDLLAFEFAQADGLHIVRFVASSTDGFAPTPGLRLSFERVFPNRITERYVRGALGRGWSHNWETWVEVAADNTVTVAGPSGSRRTFKVDCRGGYFNEPGDYATLTALGGGAFSLREKDGLLQAFRTDGRLDYVQDPNNNRITCGYSGGLLTSLSHSSGQSLQLAYTGGLISSITDPVGRQTTFTYAGDHLASTRYFDGSVVRYSYSTGQGITREHALTEIEHPGGTHEFFGYDARGRLASTSRDGGAEAVNFSFDSAGLVNATDALGKTSKLFLDQHGLLAKVENPEGSTVRLNYDDKFNLTSLTDPAGRSHAYSYDAKGNLIDTIDPLGSCTRFSYDGPFQRLGTLLDAKGNPTRYSHDAQGNLTAITYANNTVERWAYDGAGNPTTWTNRRADTIQYVFNPTNGLLAAKLYPDGSRATYDYDSRGNLAAASNYTGRITMDYYPDDRLRRITYPGDRWLEYTYNTAGQRASMTDQFGYRLDYDYDIVGRLRSMTNSAGTRLVLYEYDLAGRLARKTLGNGVYTSYTYDNAGQLLTLTNARLDHSVLSLFNYTYDSRGRRTAMATHYGAWTYEYDDLGQLTHAVLASTDSQIPNQDLRYEYDAMGNRVLTVENGVTMGYSPNNLNQYVNAGAGNFEFTADGNLYREVSAGETNIYTFDYEGHLRRISKPMTIWDYDYDAFGSRISSATNGIQTEFLFDPVGMGNIVGVFDSAGNLKARMFHGLNLVAAKVEAGTQQYYTFDGTGDASEIHDGTGLLRGSIAYAPFGATLTAQTISGPVPRFVGALGVMDDGNGLHSMRRRFYSAVLGRFISPDPIGLLSGDLNYHRYARNSPTMFSDPTGLRSSGQEFEDIRQRVGERLQDLRDGGFTWGPKGQFPPFWSREYQRTHIKCFEMQEIMRREIETVDPEQWKTYDATRLDNWGMVMGHFYIVIEDRSTGKRWKLDPWELVDPTDPGQYGLPVVPFDNPENVYLKEVPLWRPRDPNDLLGPGGFGTQNFIASGSLLPYRINFENATNATAPAQQVVVGDPLNANLDWATLELTEIGFGDHLIAVPPNTQHFEKTEKLQVNGFDFEVQIEAGIRLATGEVYARFQSINPTNGLPPPVNVGFLPPEDGTGRGQGHASYVIRPKTGLLTGTEIRNIATITFDGLETIRTDQVDPHNLAAGYDTNKQALVTIDADAPTSAVIGGDGTLLQGGWVTWSGSDAGAGVAGYDIYVSEDHGPWRLWLSGVTTTSTQFHGTVGKTYSFYSVARDNAGQVQATPSQANTSFVLVEGLVLSARLSGNTLTIGFPTEAAGHYRLETRSGLVGGSWATEAGFEDMQGTGSRIEVNRLVENSQQRYYRVVRFVGP
ncbi:MAG: RHS repeat-associated core domain-containing protein [Verrucomicrobiota bacterium]